MQIQTVFVALQEKYDGDTKIRKTRTILVLT